MLLQTYEYVMQVALPAASRAAGQVIDKVTIIVDLGTWGLMDMPKASVMTCLTNEEALGSLLTLIVLIHRH